jgi:signal peptide peptidase SppA
MSNNYSHIMDKIMGTPWVITPESLQTILSIMDRKIAGEDIDTSEYAFGPMQGDHLTDSQEGPVTPVGVLNINGPIFPKANMMTQMSGATSVEKLQSDFRQMLSDDTIKSIVLNIDSPGGMSDLIMEMGDEIYSARGQKPIVAVANTTACSAAYWLGSQAEKLFVTPSGQVGSVGVYTVHQDKSAQQEKEGVSTTMISAGKYKVEGSPFGPLSDDAKEHMQERVDETYSEFISAVARGRGTTDDIVKEAYGSGRTYHAKTALAMNMVDGIQTLDSVVGGMMDYSTGGYATTTTGGSTQWTYVPTFSTEVKEGENSMEPLTPETLAALGLSEEATTEEIEEAVSQLVMEVTPIRNASAHQLAFAEQFPEQARMLEDLKARDIEQSAKLFSESYAQFSQDSAHGFSGVALEMIGDMHKQISAGGVTHDDFKEFLDLFSTKAAIVDYTERGTSREAEAITAESARDAGNQIATLAHAAIAEAGGSEKLSWGDALAQVATANPELTAMYQNSVGGGE